MTTEVLTVQGCLIQLTVLEDRDPDDTTALLTVRGGKDHDLDPAALRTLGAAMLAAAGRLDPAGGDPSTALAALAGAADLEAAGLRERVAALEAERAAVVTELRRLSRDYMREPGGPTTVYKAASRLVFGAAADLVERGGR